jgi:hypothetical protein
MKDLSDIGVQDQTNRSANATLVENALFGECRAEASLRNRMSYSYKTEKNKFGPRCKAKQKQAVTTCTNDNDIKDTQANHGRAEMHQKTKQTTHSTNHDDTSYTQENQDRAEMRTIKNKQHSSPTTMIQETQNQIKIGPRCRNSKKNTQHQRQCYQRNTSIPSSG